MNIFVLSARSLVSNVSYDPIYELEDIILKTCNAQLLVPTPSRLTEWVKQNRIFMSPYINKASYKLNKYYNSLDSTQLSHGNNVLLLVGISGAELLTLTAIPSWRQRFDIVAAYIFDAWGVNCYPKFTNQIDAIFVPMPEVIPTLQEALGVPIFLLPFGSDVLTHGSGQLNRPFDLASYGRIPENYHKAFTNKFNQPGSGRIYYRFTPRTEQRLPKTPYEQRRDQEDRLLLFKILRRTQLAMTFDSVSPEMRQFPFPFITLRWFECGASGCALIGKRPNTPIAQELLDWEDATIELPDNPQASLEFVEELLQDTERLNAIHKRNYIQNLTKHDWRLRIKSMLEQLGVPLPEPLTAELSQINKIQIPRIHQEPS